MRGATWRTHSLRVAIAGLLTRFDRVTSAHALSVPLWGRPFWGRPFGDDSLGTTVLGTTLAKPQGNTRSSWLPSKLAWVRVIWAAAKPAERSRANRPEPSALGRSSLRPELELVPKLAASLSKPRIANPHRWAAH